MAMVFVAPSSASSAPSDSDEMLLVRFRGGDEEAFAKLYGRHRAALYRFIRGLCSNPSQADEVFQETWLALIRSHAACARFKTWLYQIARHRLIDHWRKYKGEAMNSEAFDALGTAQHSPNSLPETLGEGNALALETPETLVLRAEQLQHISKALETLPLPQREVFLLRAHADMELADIAALTETPLEAVKSRYRYALAKLRQRLLDMTVEKQTGTTGITETAPQQAETAPQKQAETEVKT
jgi:RNA polymerase sigma-70 factor (ECF subfamily)